MVFAIFGSSVYLLDPVLTEKIRQKTGEDKAEFVVYNCKPNSIYLANINIDFKQRSSFVVVNAMKRLVMNTFSNKIYLLYFLHLNTSTFCVRLINRHF